MGSIENDLGAGQFFDWNNRLSSNLSENEWSVELQPIVEKLSNNLDLDLIDGQTLFAHKDINEIGRLASIIKQAKFSRKVFF